MSDAKRLRYKLLVTIVTNKIGRKIVKILKKAGVEGDTVLVGRGTATPKKKHIWDIEVEPEREIIFTLMTENLLDIVLARFTDKFSLEKPGTGIAFVIDIPLVAGVCHSCEISNKEKFIEVEVENMADQSKHILLMTIVNKGNASKVVDAACSAGATGGTIINGRGSGIHEKATLFGIDIEPEKEVIMSVIAKNMQKEILQEINKEANLNQPGEGIAFVIPLEQVIGMREDL